MQASTWMQHAVVAIFTRPDRRELKAAVPKEGGEQSQDHMMMMSGGGNRVGV